MSQTRDKPILFVDVDGVISLLGFSPASDESPGVFHWVDGVAHCIPPSSGERLVRLSERFDLVWATGWEQSANDHLPFILKLPFQELPCLTFGSRAVFGSAHWKLDAISECSGERPVAWIDDNHDDACKLWALGRDAPTLLVGTRPAVGMTEGSRASAGRLGRRGHAGDGRRSDLGWLTHSRSGPPERPLKAIARRSISARA